MAINKLTSTKGNIRGVNNCASFGKNKITKQTASGTISIQSGTKLVDVLVVAGGGGGSSGGGGAGGFLQRFSRTIPVGTHPVTVGSGAAAQNPNAGAGADGIVIIRYQ